MLKIRFLTKRESGEKFPESPKFVTLAARTDESLPPTLLKMPDFFFLSMLKKIVQYALQKRFWMAFGAMWLFSFGISAQNTDSLMLHYRYMADRYMIKNKYLYNYFEIDAYGIRMFANSKRKRQGIAEFHLPWNELESFKKLIRYADRQMAYGVYTSKGKDPLPFPTMQSVYILEQNHRQGHPPSENPFLGLKVAIDPGHIAGNLKTGMIEQRFVQIKTEEKTYELVEGALTLQTAQVLKDSLERNGATVMMTREKQNRSASGISFRYWKKYRLPKKLKRKGLSPEEIEQTIKETHPAIFFNQFENEDLNVRADKINYFKPDLTVVLHYNVDVENTLWRKPTEKNYALTFIPGAYLAGELSSRLERFDFLRRLLTEQVAASESVSKFVLQEFNALGIPTLTDEEAPSYVRKQSLKVGEGIYARNLRLCRLLNSPICYGEPLLQDNFEELKRLTTINEEAGISERVVDVANAYFRGIKSYLLQQNRLK